jgi:hypothetical protein
LTLADSGRWLFATAFTIAWARLAAWEGFVTVGYATKECGSPVGYVLVVEAVAVGVLAFGLWAVLAAPRWWFRVLAVIALLLPVALGYVSWIVCNAW